ncbi:MAG: tetratricopeptide repeat protein, partial [Burkholderiales bacterium]
RSQGRLAEAEQSYRRALEIKPNFSHAHFNLGVMLQKQWRLAEAEMSYRRALEINSRYADAHCNLGVMLQQRGKLLEAETSYRSALQINPNLADAYGCLGVILANQKRFSEAEVNFRRALEFKPDIAEIHSNLGSTLKELGRLAEAEASCRRALVLKPDHAEAHWNLGVVFSEQGRFPEAEISYRHALQINPDFDVAYTNLLFCLSHNVTVDAQALFAEHCKFGEQFEQPLRASWPQHRNSRDPHRGLRIGIVSADLHSHPIASYFEPLLANLTRSSGLTMYAYFNNTIEDHVTHRLRRQFKHWDVVAGLSDVALAKKIMDDGIDILIDLSGHTGKNRLLSFARKPAPLQASWMGYPGTTGLQAMDYYIADRFLVPPGQFDAQFTEKVVRLPANAPFLPFETAPPVSALPALSNGYITFGSFNRTNKLSRAVIALWSALLRALPESRMLLGAMQADGNNEMLIDWFTQEGIARERLDFHPRSGMPDYLALHRQVDLCLDAFPYAGATTTLHALWMGVPTLTLAGQTMAGRTGDAVAGHIGLEQYVAQDKADFVERGLAIAGNKDALATLRAGLRERLAQSTLCQPELIAAGLECALRTMWQRWCAGLPAESFEVTLQDIATSRQAGDRSVL